MLHQAVFEMLLKVMCVLIHIKGDFRAGCVSLKSEYWYSGRGNAKLYCLASLLKCLKFKMKQSIIISSLFLTSNKENKHSLHVGAL